MKGSPGGARVATVQSVHGLALLCTTTSHNIIMEVPQGGRSICSNVHNSV